MKGGKLMLIQFDKNNEIESKKEIKRTHCFNCKKNINSQELINDTESNLISNHPWLIGIIEDLQEKLKN